MIAKDTYFYSRRVAFADTDAMGVVHHVNYVKYFEEARVGWMRARGLEKNHYPQSDMCLAVIESQCRHLRPLRFDEEIKIYVQVRGEVLKIYMQYVIVPTLNESEWSAVGQTILVPLNKVLKPIRVPQELRQQLEKEKWTETWLSNL